MQSYINWYNHGEPYVLNKNIHDNEMSDGDHMDGIDTLVGDRIKGKPRNATEDEEVHHFDKWRWEGGTSRDANENEEHDIPDVNLDMDYDM